MTIMPGNVQKQFTQFYQEGLEARNNGKHMAAIDALSRAEAIAAEYEDRQKHWKVLNVIAIAYAKLGKENKDNDRFEEAFDSLATASDLAHRLEAFDLRYMTVSNLGRVATIGEITFTEDSKDLTEGLSLRVLQSFKRARRELAKVNHPYFEYANAMHGAPVAAVSGDWHETSNLLSAGYSAAFKMSSEKNSYEIPAEIDASGLSYLAESAKLLAVANQDLVSQEEFDQQRVKVIGLID
jgi:hypothetical protein